MIQQLLSIENYRLWKHRKSAKLSWNHKVTCQISLGKDQDQGGVGGQGGQGGQGGHGQSPYDWNSKV